MLRRHFIIIDLFLPRLPSPCQTRLGLSVRDCLMVHRSPTSPLKCLFFLTIVPLAFLYSDGANQNFALPQSITTSHKIASTDRVKGGLNQSHLLPSIRTVMAVWRECYGARFRTTVCQDQWELSANFCVDDNIGKSYRRSSYASCSQLALNVSSEQQFVPTCFGNQATRLATVHPNSNQRCLCSTHQ